MPTKRNPPTTADKPAQRTRFEVVNFIFSLLDLGNWWVAVVIVDSIQCPNGCRTLPRPPGWGPFQSCVCEHPRHPASLRDSREPPKRQIRRGRIVPLLELRRG